MEKNSPKLQNIIIEKYIKSLQHSRKVDQKSLKIASRAVPGGVSEPPDSFWAPSWPQDVIWHDFGMILGGFWEPSWVPRWHQNRLKIDLKIDQKTIAFLIRKLTILDAQNLPK